MGLDIKYKEWVGPIDRVRGDAQGRLNLLRLDKNERITPLSHKIWREVESQINDTAISSYPEQECLYDSLAHLHNLKKENFVLTAGSDAAIRNVFDLCVKPRDKVITLKPTFAMIDVYCQLYDANQCAIECKPDLTSPSDDILKNIDETTSLVILANPNSPTGTIIEPKKLKSIFLKAQEHKSTVLMDEAYYEFYGESSLGLIHDFPNLVVTRTFSKACGLAGLRIGYLVACEPLIALFYKFRPMYEVNSISVLFAKATLNNLNEVEQYVVDVNKGKNYLQKQLKELGLEFLDTKANFIHINFGESKDRVLKHLNSKGIRVRSSLPFEEYDTFLRVTLGPEEIMKKFVMEIKRTCLN